MYCIGNIKGYESVDDMIKTDKKQEPTNCSNRYKGRHSGYNLLIRNHGFTERSSIDSLRVGCRSDNSAVNALCLISFAKFQMTQVCTYIIR